MMFVTELVMCSREQGFLNDFDWFTQSTEEFNVYVINMLAKLIEIADEENIFEVRR